MLAEFINMVVLTQGCGCKVLALAAEKSFYYLFILLPENWIFMLSLGNVTVNMS